MKHVLFILFAFMACNASRAQNDERRPLQGIISIGELTADEEEVQIVNLQTKQKAATTIGGYFTIPVKVGDSLLFSGTGIISMKMKLANADVSRELVPITLNPAGTQLKEVKVDHNINSKSVGISAKEPKAYTPAERKLKNAKTTSPTREVDRAYTAVGTDPLINAVSGRTAALKKQAQVEKKESSKAKLSEAYEKSYFTDTLKIPADYVEGFLYFVVEDKRFVNTLDSGYQEQIDYQLASLATEYKKTLKSETK